MRLISSNSPGNSTTGETVIPIHYRKSSLCQTHTVKLIGLLSAVHPTAPVDVDNDGLFEEDKEEDIIGMGNYYYTASEIVKIERIDLPQFE